VTGQNR